MEFKTRRLVNADAEDYQKWRMEGLSRHPEHFRVSTEDEIDLNNSMVAAKLESNFVIGGFDGASLVGIAGLSIISGSKLRHKGLLWGMYVRSENQGQGLADQLIESIIAEAMRIGLEQIQLTVVAQNLRAYKVYERWGFKLYATEVESVKTETGYLDEQLRVLRLKS